jgi:hypothetical protein
MYSRLLLPLGVAAIACSSSGSRSTVRVEPSPVSSPSTPHAPTVTAPGCLDAVLVVEDGHERGLVCEADRPKGTTIVDLRDEWTPRLFAPAADGTAPDFRASYLALARENDIDGKPLPPNTGLTELYGIVPALSIVRQRFSQEPRYACHAKLDPSPIAKLTRPYGEEHAGLVKFQLRQRKVIGAILERVRIQKQLPDYVSFAADKELGPSYEKWRVANELITGIEAAQRQLACEGFLADKAIDGAYSWAMGKAVELYQRRHFLIPNSRLDPETRVALATDPHELDFRFALRVLRERVVDATGLIEDGTAGKGPSAILGRRLDPEAMRGVRGQGRPLANAASDLVSAATEAAAQQLGWTTHAAAEAFLARHPGGVRVAIALPPAPSYHAAHMELSAEIDRGDVWYDDKPSQRIAWRRPSLVLFVQDGTTKRPLIRWPTTIGGWSDVRIGGGLVKRWKESDVGPRQWRELYAAPTWLPPASTPDEELVRWLGPGKWELKKAIMGPGPMAAFGMMLLPHHAALRGADGKTRFVNNGIGTHGSAVVTSILNGTSHGCHRLYNQLAVRLGSFLLAHRTHARKGQAPEHYRRVVRAMGTYTAKIDTRGFLYELTPPVSIEVLPGTIRTERKVPPLASVPAGAD